MIKAVTTAYEGYSPTQAARAIQAFVVDDLSNWYVRLNRKRFWKSEHGPDKQAAYQTLYTCLTTVVELAAPIAPFYTEQLYQALHHGARQSAAPSVHLTDFPGAHEGMIDLALEKKMHQAQQVVSLVHSLRKKHRLKVRQPLSKLLLPLADAPARAQLATLAPLIQAEVNVKHITYASDTAAVVTKTIKPNFKALGQRYGPHMKALTQALAQLGQADIQRLEAAGQLTLPLTQEEGLEGVTLTPADVLITSEDIPGWAVASAGDITVALDITLDDALRQEGLARDLVNRLQNLRKAQGLAVQDKIKLTLATEEPWVVAAMQQHQAYICHETQALQLVVVEEVAQGTSLDLDGHAVQVHMAVHA